MGLARILARKMDAAWSLSPEGSDQAAGYRLVIGVGVPWRGRWRVCRRRASVWVTL